MKETMQITSSTHQETEMECEEGCVCVCLCVWMFTMTRWDDYQMI